jgi:serine/threonine-protein kinase SRK2
MSFDPNFDHSGMQEPLRHHKQYVKIKDLNSGTSGFVQLAYNLQTGEQVAIKFIERGIQMQRIVARELLNHRMCALHPHIVQLKEVFLTPHHLAIAMEYAAGGDLSEYVQANKLPGMGILESDARWLFQQLLIAVDYCHRLGIANRDIKLDNVLLDGSLPLPIIKMCDFGYSKDEDSGSVCKTACGTPEYMAPEVLDTESYDGKQADIWSCGVMLYVMLTAQFPFRRPGDNAVTGVRRMQLMFERIIAADYAPITHVSEACQDLLRRMMTSDPKNRISVQGIMQHPWFLHDLPPGTLDVNTQLQSTDTERYSSCRQTSQEILELVNACNAQRDNVKRRVTDIRKLATMAAGAGAPGRHSGSSTNSNNSNQTSIQGPAY